MHSFKLWKTAPSPFPVCVRERRLGGGLSVGVTAVLLTSLQHPVTERYKLLCQIVFFHSCSSRRKSCTAVGCNLRSCAGGRMDSAGRKVVVCDNGTGVRLLYFIYCIHTHRLYHLLWGKTLIKTHLYKIVLSFTTLK